MKGRAAIPLHARSLCRVIFYVTRFLLGLAAAVLYSQAAPPDLNQVLAGVEQRYNRARTLQVLFQQTYEVPHRGKKIEAGTLFLRKPGRMRWQYSDPAGKLFLSDGKYMYLYVPGDSRVERSKVKDTEDMRAPLAFLLGRLDFQRDFKKFIYRRDGDNTLITAVPRSDRAPFSQVEFRVTPAFEIRDVQVLGQDNSSMEFRFSQEKINPALAENLFQFKAPPGAQIVEAVEPTQ